MQQAQKAVALEAIRAVSDDIGRLASAEHEFTRERCQAAIENLALVKAFIESLNGPVLTKKLVNLHKTDNDARRVYYTSQEGLLYCFDMQSRTDFFMYLCNTKGELSIATDAKAFAVDLLPGGDSMTSGCFRSWASKHLEVVAG